MGGRAAPREASPTAPPPGSSTAETAPNSTPAPRCSTGQRLLLRGGSLALAGRDAPALMASCQDARRQGSPSCALARSPTRPTTRRTTAWRSWLPAGSKSGDRLQGDQNIILL